MGYRFWESWGCCNGLAQARCWFLRQAIAVFLEDTGLFDTCKLPASCKPLPPRRQDIDFPSRLNTNHPSCSLPSFQEHDIFPKAHHPSKSLSSHQELGYLTCRGEWPIAPEGDVGLSCDMLDWLAVGRRTGLVGRCWGWAGFGVEGLKSGKGNVGCRGQEGLNGREGL